MSSINNAPVPNSPYTQPTVPTEKSNAASKSNGSAALGVKGSDAYATSSVSDTSAETANVRGLLSGRTPTRLSQTEQQQQQPAAAAKPEKKHKSLAAKIRGFFKKLVSPFVAVAKAITAPLRAGINFLKNLKHGLGPAIKAGAKTLFSPLTDAAKSFGKGLKALFTGIPLHKKTESASSAPSSALAQNPSSPTASATTNDNT